MDLDILQLKAGKWYQRGSCLGDESEGTVEHNWPMGESNKGSHGCEL